MKYKKITYGSINNSNLKVLIRLSRTTQGLHRRSGAIFGQKGLTTSQFSVLEILYHKGDLTINEIIENILSTSGNITVVIKNLEKECLVVRYGNPNDKRSSLISITEKGREKVEEIFPIHLKDLEESLINLSEEEKQVLTSILRKIKY
ncbi:HTH-type transcriptional regulator MhqR [Clostridium puniceum]|uniref:HTH-type transcriptional regulator MhqR n=1 Tax=Clostridium puniceum TaxID=29367 RepID=A0A1S8T8Z2_9CLOT|nr:MarR family transcriptional regulator [Clostridium puniceum]OOM74216.1 HTH-type transcriptional regulator MhqR [Clostridium puniceum]